MTTSCGRTTSSRRCSTGTSSASSRRRWPRAPARAGSRRRGGDGGDRVRIDRGDADHPESVGVGGWALVRAGAGSAACSARLCRDRARFVAVLRQKRRVEGGENRVAAPSGRMWRAESSGNPPLEALHGSGGSRDHLMVRDIPFQVSGARASGSLSRSAGPGIRRSPQSPASSAGGRTARQFYEAGITDSQIQTMTRPGWLQPRLPGRVSSSATQPSPS